MIETVASVGLAIDERLTIFKNRIQPEKMTGNEKRICIVTGIHGDELEGQYVCYELNRILREQKERVKGIVDIYPAMNPLGVDSITRGVPGFDIDMNRIFPGSEEGDGAYRHPDYGRYFRGGFLCGYSCQQYFPARDPAGAHE